MDTAPNGSQNIPVITQTDPGKAHAIHLAQTAEKLAQSLTSLTAAGKAPKAIAKELKPADPPPEAKEAPVDGGGENIVDQTSEVAPSDAASTEQTSSEGDVSQATGEKTAEVAVKESAAARLKKSLEIQQRAEAARKKATAEAKQSEIDRKEAARLKQQAEEDSRKIDSLKADYEAKLRKLQTNPLEWATENGISGAQMAKFVQEGADPRKREIDMLREDFHKAVTAVREEAKAQVKGLIDERNQARQAAVANQFFSFVDDAVKSAPEVYKALDVVYSKEELLAKAEELGERNERLQLGWTPDKLLEEIEIEAQADPRWQKIKSRFQPAPKATTTPPTPVPKAQQQNKSPAQEETFVERSGTRSRSDNGQFAHETPQSRHNAHLKRVLANVRL